MSLSSIIGEKAEFNKLVCPPSLFGHVALSLIQVLTFLWVFFLCYFRIISTYSNKSLPSINEGHVYLRSAACSIVLFIFQSVWKPVYLICVSSVVLGISFFFFASYMHLYLQWIRGSKMGRVDVCLHLCMCERVGGGGMTGEVLVFRGLLNEPR